MYVKSYSGPKTQIQPEELQKHEATKIYVAEQKIDGHWCEASTNTNGEIVSLLSRSGTAFADGMIEDIMGLQTSCPDSVFVGELEAGTEAANVACLKRGHKVMHVFDVVKLLGQDVTKLTNDQRRVLLETAFMSCDEHITLTERVNSGFLEFFEQVTEQGGEGIVLKRCDATYKQGKSTDWIRCKRHRYVDYFVMSIGCSNGGSPNFQVGLIIDGKMTRVATIKNIPNGLDYDNLIGHVIECKGFEVHQSGAIRHGHYCRTRNDKHKEECTLEAALIA